jgi:hypothetical protein
MGLVDWLITPKNQKKKNILPCFEHKPLIKSLKTSTCPKIYFPWPLHKEYGVKSELIENNMEIQGNHENHLRFFSKSYENFIFQNMEDRGVNCMRAMP